MGLHTGYTRDWLDRRFQSTTDSGLYHAHQPIYGIGHAASEPGHPRRVARTLQMMRVLARLEFETMLDVGGGEGYISECARRIFGCKPISCDLSIEACCRAFDLFGLDSCAVTSFALPFPDDAFDVVVCSEVLEHVEHPIETLAELQRVARHAVLLTTEECELDRESIERHLFERCGFPHFERNVFHPDDLRALFGDDISMRSQLRGIEFDGEPTPDRVRTWALRATEVDRMVDGGIGVVMVALRTGRFDYATEARVDDDAILDVLCAPLRGATPLEPTRRAEPLSGLVASAVCPECRAPLRPALVCSACSTRFEAHAGTADLTARTDAARDRTETALAARWPAERVRFALDLRDRLDLPMAESCRTWDFTAESDRRGWMPNADLDTVEQDSTGWCLRSKQTPWLVSPGIGLAGSAIAAIELTMRIYNPDFAEDAGVGQLYWLTQDDTDFGPAQHIVFPIVNDDRVHTYRVDLAAHPNWPSDRDIVCLRLDPVNGPCAIELISFALVPLGSP